MSPNTVTFWWVRTSAHEVFRGTVYPITKSYLELESKLVSQSGFPEAQNKVVLWAPTCHCLFVRLSLEPSVMQKWLMCSWFHCPSTTCPCTSPLPKHWCRLWKVLWFEYMEMVESSWAHGVNVTFMAETKGKNLGHLPRATKSERVPKHSVIKIIF